MAIPRYDADGNERPPLPEGAWEWCRRCGKPLRTGQAYCSMIPFRGSWGGFMHRYCPPTLTVVR
jgi:hypothetical protein